METTGLVTLLSGRKVAVHRLAEGKSTDPTGHTPAHPPRTIVFCHPAPGAGNFDPDPAETAKRDITLIALDRPGYGGSEMVKGDAWSSVDGCANDIAQVLQQMKIEAPGSVGVAGWSAGGRVALALAAQRPDLVDRVVIIGTPAPDEAVSWIPPEQKHMLEALRGKLPAEVHRTLAAQLSQMLPPDNASAAQKLQMMGRSAADDWVLELPGAAERLGQMLQAAFAQGHAGDSADIAGYCLRPWGFEPADVKAKTLCLYGAKDALGARHGSWWQKNLPNARLEMVPDVGHLLAIPMWGRALSHLAPGHK